LSKRSIKVDDFKRFELPSNPALSPDGRYVVYEVTVANDKEDDYDIQLYIASVDGEHARQLTTGGSKNSAAVWSPDGQFIAFQSNRSESSQVWLLPMDGGEARQLTRFKQSLHSLAWSGEGQTLYGLVAAPKNGDVEVFEVGLSTKEIKEQQEKVQQEFAKNAKRYAEIYYKADGTGFSNGFKSQLVAVDVATTEHRQLTQGGHSVTSFAVAPDDQQIAFTMNAREDTDVHWWYSDIYTVPTQGGDISLLNNQLIARALAYSPDASQLAVFGHGEEHNDYWSASHTHLFVLSANGKSCRQLTIDFPDTLGDTCLSDMRGGVRQDIPAWSADGQFIFSLSSREGRSEIIRVPAGVDAANELPLTDITTIIGGDREIYSFSCDGENQFALVYATPTHPGVVVMVDVSESRQPPHAHRVPTEVMTEETIPFFPAIETRLDSCSEAVVSEVTLIQPEAFWFNSVDNWRVQGWVMKPANYMPGKQYPVILEIHGGPQLNYGHAIFHEMQWLAAQGYAIVFVNPRGGMSYGQEFVNAVRHHYGENDAEDIINGLDAALAQFDFLDGKRVAVTGGSYGGFMTNWLVGHTSRFFAAVSQRSISNWISFYGVSDIGPLFVESQHGGTIFDSYEYLRKISPLTYVENVTTPLLLVHSENDLRCPIEQAEQFHTALKRLGKEVQIFRVPNASHGLSRNGKPSLRLQRLEAIYQWIDDRLPQS